MLAIHCCGLASDLAQLSAFKENAAFIMCPCCLGKIQQFTNDDTKIAPELVPTYPRSNGLQQVCSAIEFATIAAAADHPTANEDSQITFSDNLDEETVAANRTRAFCKVIVERDRQLAANERGYSTILTTLNPLAASPKHDVIIGIPGDVDCDLQKIFYPESHLVCV